MTSKATLIMSLSVFIQLIFLGMVSASEKDIGHIGFSDTLACGSSKHTDDHFQGLLGRIVGGVNAVPHEWPWQISMQLVHPRVNLNHFCGGALIDKQIVLTAAHCVKNGLFQVPEASVWRIRLGINNINKTESTEQTVRLSRVVHYPFYNAFNYDIAVLKLAQPVQFNEYVSPVCLPTANFDFTGSQCVATGWGKVDFNIKSPSEDLKEVDLEVFDNSVCEPPYRQAFGVTIQPWHLCAGTLAGGKGTCQGDSGGPMVCKKGGRWYLAGLTSFGPGCAKPGFPDIYARVSYFYSWIKQQIVASSAGHFSRT